MKPNTPCDAPRPPHLSHRAPPSGAPRPATPRDPQVAPPKHPAPYTPGLIPLFASLLPPQRPLLVLDPFAGSGRIHRLRDLLPEVLTIGTEIQYDWAVASSPTATADALRLPFANDMFDAAITSPTYGNRMADHHHARDAGPRHTYRHTLGRDLHPHNSGAMQWGAAYRAFHVAAWTELRRVLKVGAFLILNVKDHIRHGVRREVTAWHAETLRGLCFLEMTRVTVPAPCQRHGANAALRVTEETVIVFICHK